MNVKNQNDYAKALIERFAEVHEGKTPFDLLKMAADLHRKNLIRRRTFMLVELVVLIVFMVPGVVYVLRTHNESFLSILISLSFVIGFILNIFVIIPLMTKGHTDNLMQADTLTIEAEGYLAQVTWVTEKFSEKRNPQDVRSQTFEGFRQYALLEMTELRHQLKKTERKYKELADDAPDTAVQDLIWMQTRQRKAVFDTFAKFYAMHLIEGSSMKYVR